MGSSAARRARRGQKSADHSDALVRARTLSSEGRVDDACDLCAAILDADPGNIEALIQLGVLRYRQGDREKGVELLTRAVDDDPENEIAIENLIYVCDREFSRHFVANDLAGAARYARKILALDPDQPEAHTSLTTCLFMSGEPARLADFAPDIEPGRLGRNLTVACMPKSGSSWLSNALCVATGFRREYYSYGYVQHEQELHLPFIERAAYRDSVIQQHCRATAANIQIMQGFGFTTIVLVRNIFDVAVSMRDFYETGAIANTFYYGDYASMGEEAKLDLIIETMLPWYFQFYASWVLAEREKRLPLLWVGYEEMMADKPAMLTRVLEFCGITKSEDRIRDVIAQVDQDAHGNRLNKGVAGRGENILSRDQMDRIRGLARHFPSMDFSRIGL